ncbi:MAG: biotin-dependent carboxyltransferase family protein [Xanthomonadales bacterium]|nr:biotin-dependent carboxyltransferase family protein [Xanthomonadales bacterium]
MSLKIIKPGLFSTFQDLGRPGFAHLGIPASGAMDRSAAKLANQMVGNKPHEAVLEIALTGVSFQVSETCSIAICGAEFDCFVNDELVSQDQTIDLAVDDVLRMGRLQAGARAYLAVAGGYRLDKVLGSYSTLTLAKLGGFQGRILQKNDQIGLRQAHITPLKHKYAWQKLSRSQRYIVHAVPGPEYGWFNARSQKSAFSQAFKVSQQSDRMGYRLQADIITASNKSTMLSTGLMPGSLQITPDGQSILAMRDAQTSGGYPRILVVDQHDLSVLAQAKPGDEVCFFRVDQVC